VHGPSSHFIGIDIWEDALERARRKLGLHGLSNVEIVNANVESMRRVQLVSATH
jgi:ubiquinone/menaquinone biosynthesis C-methylase UbiE